MLLWGRATLANHYYTFWQQYWLTWLLRCLSWNWDLTPPRHFSCGVGDGPEGLLAFLNQLNIVAYPLLPGLKALPVWRVSLVLWPRLDLVAFDSFFLYSEWRRTRPNAIAGWTASTVATGSKREDGREEEQTTKRQRSAKARPRTVFESHR